MGTPLERLLESIDPERTLDRAEAQADQAFNSFPFRKAVITKWDEFVEYIVEFGRHLDGYLLSRSSHQNLDPVLEWAYYRDFLCGAYGQNGEKAAFEMARTGNEGGLYGVLRTLALHVAQEYAGNEIAARAAAYYAPLSVQERLDATEEYLEKCGHLLPSELTERGGIRIKADFLKVLRQHPLMIRRFRRTGR